MILSYILALSSTNKFYGIFDVPATSIHLLQAKVGEGIEIRNLSKLLNNSTKLD